MILTQKYHSATEIDEEFIPGLENLLSEFFPSFKWLVQREKLEPETTHFTYYLFFGNKHNAPVGFAGLSIKKCSKEIPWYKKLFSSNYNENQKFIDWSNKGSSEEAIIFDPMYAKAGVYKTKELIDSYFDRDDISWQTITFSRAYSEIEKSDSNTSFFEKKVATTLVKSSNSYQGYISERTKVIQKEIKLDWKKLSTTMDIDIGDFVSFKSVFEYRKNAQSLYKNLKKDPRIALHINESTQYITFEKDNEIQAIAFLIKGKKGHLFFDWKIFNEAISKKMMIQLCIMKFYESVDSTFLHPLIEEDISKECEQAGLSERNLVQINFKKNQHATA